MNQNNLIKAIQLRQELHKIAEPSMEENKTREKLMAFLKENTSLEINNKGSWFYAHFRSIDSEQKPIAFRADFDAVVCKDGAARHLCGHDGHSACLAGFALELEQMEKDRDIYLIFQPGEETGQGGAICSELIDEKEISEIYGYHNIPGYREGTLILLNHTFACASTGMEITFTGSPSHAAYPNQGKNPASLIAEVISCMDRLADEDHKGIVLGTVIGIDLGGTSYGVSPGDGILRLTLRAEYPEEYQALVDGISENARRAAWEKEIDCKIRMIEEFPATVNVPECVQRLKEIGQNLELTICAPEEPFRWSEDFGHYLKRTKGAFFGVGCGEMHPGLHTEEYRFNDRIIETVVEVYKNLL